MKRAVPLRHHALVVWNSLRSRHFAIYQSHFMTSQKYVSTCKLQCLRLQTSLTVLLIVIKDNAEGPKQREKDMYIYRRKRHRIKATSHPFLGKPSAFSDISTHPLQVSIEEVFNVIYLPSMQIQGIKVNRRVCKVSTINNIECEAIQKSITG